MALSERQEVALRLDKAKAELRAAMKKLPFDFQKADQVRVEAWKTAVHEAGKLLNRDPREPWKYEEALRAIQRTASDSNHDLALQMWGPKTQKEIVNG